MSEFRKVLLYTAIPIAVIGVASAVVAGAWALGFAPTMLAMTLPSAVALVVGIVLDAKGMTERSRGAFAGLGIGLGITVLAWMASCFVIRPGA